MPTLDDALALVTDSRFAAALQRSTDDPLEMRAGAIVNELMERGAGDELEARVLVTQAADRIGGRTTIDHVPGGNQAGHAQLRAQFRLWIPRSVIA